MQRTISAMVGKGSVNHNSRKFKSENVCPSRTYLNIDYCNKPIKKVYHELFDEVLKKYNEKQSRADRKIGNYYEKICNSNKEKPFHEIIIQIGNREDMSAENESEKCFEHIVSRIIEFRNKGNACLKADFAEKYAPSKGGGRENDPYAHLIDLANTLFNWLEYTQLAKREDGRIAILSEKQEEVRNILANPPGFIDRPQQYEYFQRKYGVDPKHRKDTRNLIGTTTITAKIIAEQKVKNAFISESLRQPISAINAKIIDEIVRATGIDEKFVEETLLKYYPKGSIGAFMTEYFEMAFKGRDEATEFEKATANIFRDVFGFSAKHVGPIGLTPDVLVLSDIEGYSAIIDNKAYSKYTISNDHHNRMVHNYIGNLRSYYNRNYPLAFFSYIAGGFGTNINKQIQAITDETGVRGSAMNVSNMIELIKRYDACNYNHSTIRDIFSVGRQILHSDFK